MLDEEADEPLMRAAYWLAVQPELRTYLESSRESAEGEQPICWLADE
jgi:hypothetical protein